jgi:hypothetical protein
MFRRNALPDTAGAYVDQLTAIGARPSKSRTGCYYDQRADGKLLPLALPGDLARAIVAKQPRGFKTDGRVSRYWSEQLPATAGPAR